VTLRIEIDRSTSLHRGAANGHNRWHPDIRPVAAVDPGEAATFELRDSRDRTLTRASKHDDLLATPSLAHPLTGPLEVRGAEPGDVLEVEIVGYETDEFGWTAIWPGSGWLGDRSSLGGSSTADTRARTSCRAWPCRRGCSRA
jgi:formamidase